MSKSETGKFILYVLIAGIVFLFAALVLPNIVGATSTNELAYAQAIPGKVYWTSEPYRIKGTWGLYQDIIVHFDVKYYLIVAKGYGYKNNVYHIGDKVWGNYGLPRAGEIMQRITRLWKEQW